VFRILLLSILSLTAPCICAVCRNHLSGCSLWVTRPPGVLVITSATYIIITIIIEFFTSQPWLGNVHLSWGVLMNRIRLDGLICSLRSSLQLNKCQELQIFAVVYTLGCSFSLGRLCESDFGVTPLYEIPIGINYIYCSVWRHTPNDPLSFPLSSHLAFLSRLPARCNWRRPSLCLPPPAVNVHFRSNYLQIYPKFNIYLIHVKWNSFLQVVRDFCPF